VTKYLLSKVNLEEINTWDDCHPCSIEVLDNQLDVHNYLTFKARMEGHPSVQALLEREPLFLYRIDEGKLLKDMKIL